jgi:hypothetical protein
MTASCIMRHSCSIRILALSNFILTWPMSPRSSLGAHGFGFLTTIYNLRIMYPWIEIYLMDDDIASAFRTFKYNPNVISAKAFSVGLYLFIATGPTFGNSPSPPSFKPIARARMALSAELSKGMEPEPEYPEYINRVQFTPPPPPRHTLRQSSS